MAGQGHAPEDNSVVLNGFAQQLEHGALLLLSPLFCGLICMFWCSLLQMYHDASIIRRRAIHLRRLRFRAFRISDGKNQQYDVHQVVPKQTSPGNSSNRLSRKLSSRRTSGLEQDFNSCQRELVDCQKKLLDCQQENIKLHEELSGVNLLKNKLADLLKRENEEKAKLEKQQSVFQSQAFSATFERDRLISEVEKFQKKEDEMAEKVAELQDRLDQVESKYAEEKSLCVDLQKELERSNYEVVLYRKVIDKFWKVRGQATEMCGSENNQERGAILLEDDEGYWSYGDLNKAHHDEATKARENLVNLRQEFDVCHNSLLNCQAEKLEESNARKQAETALLDCRQQLVNLAKQVDSELQQLSSIKASLREDISAFLLEESKQILSLQEAFQHAFKEENGIAQAKPILEPITGCLNESRDIDINISCSTEDFMLEKKIDGSEVNGEVSKASDLLDGGLGDDDDVSRNNTADDVTLDKGDDKNDIRDVAVDDCMKVAMDDSKEALAQALQEKVAALLLLSQQEERHILESNTAVVLESEISSLKQQLLQVTNEKVDALMELAQVHEELRKLQETFKQGTQHNSRTLSSGQLTPIEDFSMITDNDKNFISSESVQKASMQSYLKHLWLKGPELGARTKSFSHMLTLKSGRENDAVGIARLRVENATLRESLTSIRHLCKSANRLRLTIARVAADSSDQTESSIQAAVEAVDGVISEALHLKVALHSSLPVDDLGWNSIGSPLARAGEADPESSDYDANDDLHIVSFFGLEIVRLVLLAAQLQKRFLGQNV